MAVPATFHLQQDRGPPHFRYAVKADLYHCFPAQLIRCDGPQHWPFLSPDIHLPGFALVHEQTVKTENSVLSYSGSCNLCDEPPQLPNKNDKFHSQIRQVMELGLGCLTFVYYNSAIGLICLFVFVNNGNNESITLEKRTYVRVMLLTRNYLQNKLS